MELVLLYVMISDNNFVTTTLLADAVTDVVADAVTGAVAEDHCPKTGVWYYDGGLVVLGVRPDC